VRTSSLIGFTEAELALILVVVFAIVLPNLPEGKDNGSAKTPVDMATFKASQDSLARVRDSLRLTRAKLDSIEQRVLPFQDSLRSTLDPPCAQYGLTGGPGEIRIVEGGYSLDSALLPLDSLTARISGFTNQAEQRRCKYPMMVIYPSSLPAVQLERFRAHFQHRYFVRPRAKD